MLSSGEQIAKGRITGSRGGWDLEAAVSCGH